jgi:DNA-3-methyladenine glycosylase
VQALRAARTGGYNAACCFLSICAPVFSAPPLRPPAPSPVRPLPPAWFARPTLHVARDLLGKLLVYAPPAGPRLAGRIVETEGYLADDPAMHGWRAEFGPEGRVQPVGRAAAFFGRPGTAYVYRCYHTSWLLNVVTEPEGVPGAVLLRAVEPVEGAEAMQAHRPGLRRAVDLTNGPGKLTQAFGVADERFHGADLTRPPLYLAEDGTPAGASPVEVAVSSRIGLTRGVDRPYRFYVARHPYVSPGVPSDLRVALRTHRDRQG